MIHTIHQRSATFMNLPLVLQINKNSVRPSSSSHCTFVQTAFIPIGSLLAIEILMKFRIRAYLNVPRLVLLLVEVRADSGLCACSTGEWHSSCSYLKNCCGFCCSLIKNL